MTLRVPLLLILAVALLPARWIVAQEIPEDLLEDEHIREEFGVNTFTTPSIRKIFEDLDRLRPLPYEKLKREVPQGTPKDRTKLALALGGLIADGFLVVESEKLLDLEQVGRALWKHAQVLGAGTRLSRHTKSLLEHSALGEWGELKGELAKTQKDVEAEMVLLRDVDAAHLISLGGWLRAFQIACVAALEDYEPEKTRVLARVDIAEYFIGSLQTLEPQIFELPHIQSLATGLEDLKVLIDVPESKTFTAAEVESMKGKIDRLVSIAEGKSDAPSDSGTPKKAPATADVGNAPAN
ncbi:MAG: hypothetical protein KDM63_17620 [Verrucomicrobiae bacterium]|nr:hypothetical protein [Verrucomicrobiae bacterium]MCB1093347.1 hypothetical protein [Verrucomicrobiae bacterium]